MNAERFERAKEILLRVIDLPEAERKAVLNQVCAGDPELRADVEELLAQEMAHDPRGADGTPKAGKPVDKTKDRGLDSEATLAMNVPPAQFTSGQILGSRYRIVKLLGRGGMGEVWQAYDVKLLVDVALKSVRTERFPGERGLELLRREVRAAREVISPNVCRIFDLIDEEGQEFVSMECIDGQTLLATLRERGPLDIHEATRIASQLLGGLEAIHQAGLVHRDVKPENIMITRTGRVVLMDFGVAKGIADDHLGTIAGTPGYMAPEQLRDERLDARADIFAAGVVLAEMIAPEGIRDEGTRESIWKAVRQAPVRLSESPWRRVLERAVAGERSQRYDTARALARALEEVALRVEGAEDKRPYPGLESFTEADAEFFFGREVEVETVWKKLQRANLLAIIGPSGAGKTSFLQAGLLPAKPADWKHVLFRPGSSPFVALTRALAPELTADRQALDQLLQIEDTAQILAAIGRWRAKHPQALIVVDQFEELFTLGRPDAQAGFAELLGRIAAEADVHVLLVMRDDFLFHCHEHPHLTPIFSELTPLGPPTGSALRRALVQPALLSGYRFEDESLADEMLRATEGERGALPMLAFAAARLWEQRDRSRGLLTREAYERIGGVSGALAQHAEATLERIGSERQPIVREIFRNLVTAQGTRAAAEVDELLSVFEDRKIAGEVVRELVNARLLTSFELSDARESAGERHRVEIVHESLLTSWPRLVHWQTQDTEGAQLRDQLRQAAQLWKERHESQDLLWTGTAFKEFELWRERYPGGLTDTEEQFARAMTGRAERARRRRQRITIGTIASLVVVVAALATFWGRAQVARRSAEASKLLALGRTELESDPSAALAYAIASLELADTPVGRRFALEVLSRGPAALVRPLPGGPSGYGLRATSLDFSPDGTRLAAGGLAGVQIVPRDGSTAIVLHKGFSAIQRSRDPQFAADGDHVAWTSADDATVVRVWSLSEGRENRTFKMEGTTLTRVRGNRLFLITDATGQTESTGNWTETVVHTWAFDEKEPELIGRWNLDGVTWFDIDQSGRWVAYAKGRGVYLCPVETWGADRRRLVGEHAADASRVVFDSKGERLASADVSGEIRLWSLAPSSSTPARVIAGKGPLCGLWFDPSGGILAGAHDSLDRSVHLWDLNGPLDADPVVLRRRSSPSLASRSRFGGFADSRPAFDPSLQWIAVPYGDEVAFWLLTHPHPYVLHGGGTGCWGVCFAPDGASLVGAFFGGPVRVWNLKGRATRDLWKPPSMVKSVSVDPLGRYVVAGTQHDGAFVVSMPEGRARQLPDTPPRGSIDLVAVSRDGRFAAGARTGGKESAIRVWDLESGAARVLESTKGKLFWVLAFSPDGSLFSGGTDGTVQQWNIQDGSGTVVTKGNGSVSAIAVTKDARFLFINFWSEAQVSERGTSELTRYDLKTRTSRSIKSHGDRVLGVTLDPTETLLVTGSMDGAVRVGPITGGEPHLLLGPKEAGVLAVHPDGRWIASGDEAFEPTVHLWRIPEGVPFQTLPHDEFMNRLRALTNVRAVPDKESSTGYRLDLAPFPGWEKVPTW